MQLHGIAKAFLSVWLSIKRMLCNKTKELHIPTFCRRKIILSSFLTRRMVGGGDSFYPKFWTKLTLLERKHRFLIDIRS